jgi:hypothetical protein
VFVDQLALSGGHVRRLSPNGAAEGFALEWSPIDTGKYARLHVWQLVSLVVDGTEM